MRIFIILWELWLIESGIGDFGRGNLGRCNFVLLQIVFYNILTTFILDKIIIEPIGHSSKFSTIYCALKTYSIIILNVCK